MWMFTRRGKYVVKKLPAGSVVGSATTLLDAADVAMEDARRGPGKWVIEQPVIEVDVSKAYGVLALSGVIPAQGQIVWVTDVTASGAVVTCVELADATSYQWYLSGVPRTVTAGTELLLTGLTAGTSYTVQVAGLAAGGVSGLASEAVGFQTLAEDVVEWTGAVPLQELTVGVPYWLELTGYCSGAVSFAVVSGVLPAGLGIVGTRITGVPAGVETHTPVIRATGAAGAADSAAMTVASLNADVTAPAAPANFSAAG